MRPEGTSAGGPGSEQEEDGASRPLTGPTETMAIRLSEARLVELHRIGDRQAFDEVYRRFESMVFNLALRMAGDEDVAAEIAQETFLRIYRHLGRFRGRSSLKTWIYRITLNCCRTHLRRRHRRRTALPGAPPAELDRLPDPRSGPEERVLTHDLSERLAAAVALLPLPFREAVILRDVQGLSYDEIARALGVRLGTVRSRIARGRERLRDLWESLE